MGDSPSRVHVHIGPGALGLGLIGPVSRDAGLRLVLAGSSSRESWPVAAAIGDTGGYTLRHPVGATPSHVPVDQVIDLDQSGALRDALCDRSALLLTTPVTQSGLDQLVPLMEDALAARAACGFEAPLFVVACENTLGAVYSELAASGVAGATFIGAVVDRICEPPALDGQAVQLWTEEYGTWHLERTSSSGDLEQALSAVPQVDFVDHFAAVRLRKLYLVNGAHLVAALHAWDQGEPFMHHFVQSAFGQDLLRRALEESSDALAFRHPNAFLEGDLRNFSHEILTRFGTHPYTVANVLRNRLRPTELRSYLTGLAEKVVAPALRFLEQWSSPPPVLTQAVYVAVNLVAQGRFVQ